MSYGVPTETACPGGCGLLFTRVDYAPDPPPIPLLPGPRWFIDEREYFECPGCGAELDADLAIARLA